MTRRELEYSPEIEEHVHSVASGCRGIIFIIGLAITFLAIGGVLIWWWLSG